MTTYKTLHIGVQAAEHWIKGEFGDINLDVSVDIAQTFKNNKDSFLKEAMQVLRSAFVTGLCETQCVRMLSPNPKDVISTAFEVSSRSHNIVHSESY